MGLSVIAPRASIGVPAKAAQPKGVRPSILSQTLPKAYGGGDPSVSSYSATEGSSRSSTDNSDDDETPPSYLPSGMPRSVRAQSRD